MRTSDTLTKIAPALVKALAEIKGAAKDSKNPHFKNDYASLESVIEASRDPLAANGLCAFQGLGEIVDGKLTCTTRILHQSGEWIESEFQMPIGRIDAQGTGSAATYARRYSLMAALNVAPVDDDGEAATGRPNGQQTAITPASEGKDFWKCSGAGMSAFAAKKAGLDETHEMMRQTIADEIGTRAGMREFIEANWQDINKMPLSWRIELRNQCEEKVFDGEERAGANNPRAVA